MDSLPDGPYPFSDTLRVRYSDTDAQGHLYFANYLVYADEVAGHYMADLGYDAMRPQDAPALIFTVNVNCDFIDECRSGDLVRVAVGYRRLGTSSAELTWEIQLNESQAVLARGSITQVFVDHETRRSCPIPQGFRDAILSRQPELLA
jgi:acyl-CoA thioester hydrolase